MDWLATRDCTQYTDGSVPGIIQLKCTQTKFDSHYNFTYSTTRRYLGHAPDPFSGEMPQDLILSINSEVLQEDTKLYAIISHVLKMIEVA